MILGNAQFFIKDKNRREIDYIKEIYRKRFQSEIDNYIFQEEKPDSIQAQDVLYLDKLFI